MTEGHNSGVQGDQLRAYVRRIMNVRYEKKQLSEDEKTIFQEAKAAGYDVKALRKAIQLAALDEEFRTVLDLYVDTIASEMLS